MCVCAVYACMYINHNIFAYTRTPMQLVTQYYAVSPTHTHYAAITKSKVLF